jgi:hypothetical protein
MRPEVSALISPIYPKLQDHDHVKTYPNVKGISHNMYFVDHQIEVTPSLFIVTP